MTEKHIVVVDTYLLGEQENEISFSLDERFQDEAINELVARGQNVTFDPGAVVRDPSQAIVIEGATPVFSSIIMKHDKFRRDQPNIIDIDFKELI